MGTWGIQAEMLFTHLCTAVPCMAAKPGGIQISLSRPDYDANEFQWSRDQVTNGRRIFPRIEFQSPAVLEQQNASRENSSKFGSSQISFFCSFIFLADSTFHLTCLNLRWGGVHHSRKSALKSACSVLFTLEAWKCNDRKAPSSVKGSIHVRHFST